MNFSAVATSHTSCCVTIFLARVVYLLLRGDYFYAVTPGPVTCCRAVHVCLESTLLHLRALTMIAVDRFSAAVAVESQPSVHRLALMPSISDRSGIVKGRSRPERQEKSFLFLTSKLNERETRHVLAAAMTLYLPPEAIRNLVELVRSRRRFSGVKNRPHFFNGGRERRFLARTKS